MEQTEQKESQRIYDEIVTGMREWRAAHPKATLREIELQARKRVSRLEVYLIEESALESQARAWTGQSPEQRPKCPHCGEPLLARGKQVRHFQATAAREVKLERTSETCPPCETGFFPPR